MSFFFFFNVENKNRHKSKSKKDKGRKKYTPNITLMADMAEVSLVYDLMMSHTAKLENAEVFQLVITSSPKKWLLFTSFL